MTSKEDTEVVSLDDWTDAGIMTGNKENTKLNMF